MKTLIYKFFVCASLMLVAPSLFAQEAEGRIPGARITKLSNPAQSIGVHIGDVLNRKIELEVEAPYQISKSAFPLKGSSQNGVELVDFKVATTQSGKNTLYKLELSYQVFASANSPAVMQLPSEKFALTGGSKALSLSIPVWRFWFSPLVTGNINTAKASLQPQQPPPLVDIGSHQMRLAVFLILLVMGFVGLLYVNADRKWLPFMGGAFAMAYRKLKRLPKKQSEEKKALLYLHQAFNQVYGSNLFAQDIDKFLMAHPGFAKLKAEIGSFFDKSNQSLFAIHQQRHDGLMQELISLSKRLRDCERGV